jgi:hypothetical protein
MIRPEFLTPERRLQAIQCGQIMKAIVILYLSVMVFCLAFSGANCAFYFTVFRLLFGSQRTFGYSLNVGVK